MCCHERHVESVQKWHDIRFYCLNWFLMTFSAKWLKLAEVLNPCATTVRDAERYFHIVHYSKSSPAPCHTVVWQIFRCLVLVLTVCDGKHAYWRQEEGHGWGVPFHEKTWTHDETDGPWAAQQALYHVIVKPSPCPTVRHLHSRKHLRTKRMRGCCPLSGEDIIIYKPE